MLVQRRRRWLNIDPALGLPVLFGEHAHSSPVKRCFPPRRTSLPAHRAPDMRCQLLAQTGCHLIIALSS